MPLKASFSHNRIQVSAAHEGSRAMPWAACGLQGMRCYHKATKGSPGNGNARKRQKRRVGQLRCVEDRQEEWGKGRG